MALKRALAGKNKPVLGRFASWNDFEPAPAPIGHQVPVGGKGVNMCDEKIFLLPLIVKST